MGFAAAQLILQYSWGIGAADITSGAAIALLIDGGLCPMTDNGPSSPFPSSNSRPAKPLQAVRSRHHRAGP